MCDETAYIKWILNDGPAKAGKEHSDLAYASLAALLRDGYHIASPVMVRGSDCSDFNVVQTTVVKGEKSSTIRWNTFNKGWMVRLAGGFGWVIFRPE